MSFSSCNGRKPPESAVNRSTLVVAFILGVSFPLSSHAEPGMEYLLSSPDSRTRITLTTGDQLTYAVARNGVQLIAPSAIAMQFANGPSAGVHAVVKRTSNRSEQRDVPRVIHQKSSSVQESWNERTLEFKDGSSVIFRAYNNGVAYRWGIGSNGDVTVQAETFTINIPGEPLVWFPEEKSFFSHNERLYLHEPLKSIADTQFCSTPALIETGTGQHILISEADLIDYPGLWLKGTGSNGLTGLFPAYVLEEVKKNDRDMEPARRADYLARTRGPRVFPWRLLAIADHDGELLTNDLVFLLSRPSEITDPSWIRPGKVAWDWWNANNIYGVDFRAGLNNDTYKYYIDFASRHGIEYVILDEGWYPLGDLLTSVPAINVPELVAYGKSRNVGIILWVVWKTLQDQMTPALDLFASWGVKGIKVDFMQRDDQWMVNYYWTISREAARRKLLVDFHGACKPSGINRTLPNMLTSEGVRGLENAKWSTVTPKHCVTLPFTRMVAGPMDFTPGAMTNLPGGSFKPMWATPASMGTRCQQLAMYVVYESPLQMLCDSPTNYMREPECMAFLGPVPSVWDRTVVLDAKVGTYVLLARQSGSDWYVGGMTDEQGRTLSADLSFLGTGTFTAEIWQDGINADRHGNDFRKITQSVSSTTKLTVPMAPGGGWVARIHQGI
jgi:alpha-glucosidase